MRRLVSSLLLATALSASAMAQDNSTDTMKDALAAGYKASFICSATFNADQSLREINLNELSGIYPDYRERVRALPDADVNLRDKTVSVSFDSDLPPRLAVWRAGLGCTQLPIGANADAIDFLPRFDSFPDLSGRDERLVIGSNVVPDPVSLASYGTFDAPVEFAFDGSSYGDGTKTSAVLILHRGQILAERYGRGINATTPQRAWSVSKSLAATLVGVADEKGMIDLDFPAVIEAWSSGADPRRDITLRNLLQMASGLDSGETGSRTDRVYFGGARVIDTALTRPLEAEPGKRFKYANNDTLAAMRGLREAIDDDGAYLRFPYEELLWKLGAYHTTFETDWNGDYLASSQVWTTARDLARIGQLYLQDGRWNGERLLPDYWVDFVSTPAPAQPNGEFGYGAQFWLFQHEGVPGDAFAAMGHRGQYLVIIPSRDLVIVRRGYDSSGETRFDIARFTADINAALYAAQAAREAEILAAFADEEAEAASED